MPQMSPLLWLNMLLIFSLMYYIHMCLIYSIYYPYPMLLSMNYMKIYTKWMW